jgi:uncharacterized RmlC-like cupin family protein
MARRRGGPGLPIREAGITNRVSDYKRIVALARDGLTAAPGYPGITRELAFQSDRACQVRARGDGLAATGWHHHGDREVFGYLVKGRARFEFGPGGSESVEVEAGGFFRVPAGLVHRDVNPIDEEQEFVLVFAGGGPLVVDMDGPDPGGQSPSGNLGDGR